MTAEATRIRLLGRFLVLRAGQEVPAAAFGGRKVRLLVRVLAARPGEHLSHDTLADALWADGPPADPAANLGVLINRARRALGDPALITTTTRGYTLGRDCAVDAHVFADRVAAARAVARSGDHRQALRAYVSAFEEWSGEPLPEDADAVWAQPFRRRLLDLHQSALEEACGTALAVGEPVLAVSLARDAVDGDPLREGAHLLLARAHRASGDRAAALEVLRRLRRTLVDELGVEPSAEAARLLKELVGTGGGSPPVRPPTPVHELEFVGRSAQLAELLAALTPPDSGSRAADVVHVLGAAGSGKSRLLAEAMRARTGTVIAARAFQPERSEPWSLARTLLREALLLDAGIAAALPARAVGPLADLVPELAEADADAPTGLDPQTRRALVLEGGVRMLAAAGRRGAALVVDDVQWADASSLTMLASVLDREPTVPCVLARRPEEIPDDGQVPALLDGLGTRRPTRSMRLPPLTTADLSGLADPAIAAVLAEETDGSPFAVAEVLRGLAQRGAVTRDALGCWRAHAPDAAPLAVELGRAGRRRRMQARVARHDAPAREVLAALALLARPVSAQTLATAVGGTDREVLSTLSALASGGLVRLDDRGWITSHDLVRETVAQDLDPSTRGRIHAILAPALAAEGADPAELARHHAGAGAPDAAARCYAAAARAVLERSDGTGAPALVEAGLALASRDDVRDELVELRAAARARSGDLGGARADLRSLLGACPPGGRRARLLARLAELFSGAENLSRAAELAESSVLEAAALDPVGRPAALARALEVAAVIDMNLEHAERSRRRSARALALYREVGDARGAARITDARAMATFLDGGISAAIGLFGRVADLFTDSGDLLRVVTPESTGGHALVFHGEPGQGLERTTAALDLARSLGHREGQTYALWHRSEALVGVDRPAEALHDAREALTIAEGLGHRGWTCTALRALGIALAARGDLDDAADAFRRSLDEARGLSLFASWAASRLALVRIAVGAPDDAEPLVRRALVEGPALAGYEARWAAVELAAARSDTRTAELALDAARQARAGGHLAVLPRLEALAPATG